MFPFCIFLDRLNLTLSPALVFLCWLQKVSVRRSGNDRRVTVHVILATGSMSFNNRVLFRVNKCRYV